MEFQPYLMRVSISDLNIRKAPGTDKPKNGKEPARPSGSRPCDCIWQEVCFS